MPFSRVAFKRHEHEKITAYMMGNLYDQKLFMEVNSYIDSRRGPSHREQHGHDEVAETFIKETWGDKGVEIFRIHILSDWLHENLGQVVDELYRRLASGEFPLPYYSSESSDSRPKLPVAAPTLKGCTNCGAEDIELTETWFRPLCTKCRTARNLESCVNCHNLFAKQDRVESPDSPGNYICPVCKAECYAE